MSAFFMPVSRVNAVILNARVRFRVSTQKGKQLQKELFAKYIELPVRAITRF